MHAAFFCVALCLGQVPDETVALIDQQLALYQREHKITPADACTDREYLRRVSLDLIGRIPTPSEIDLFTKDDAKQRRTRLVERLLAHPDAARRQADIWMHSLLGAMAPGDAQQAFHSWLQIHFTRKASHKELAEKLILATGSTRDNPAGHFLSLLRGLSVHEKEHARSGAQDMIPATNQVIRVFLGRRIQCVECHDHPFNDDLNQHHYYAANLFFRQVEFKKFKVGKDTVEEVRDNPKLNESGYAPYERRNTLLLFTAPKLLDGATWTAKTGKTRRVFFAEQLAKHPDFARAFAQRQWGWLLGRGLCETDDLDDLGKHNPVVHEPILDALAKAFVKSGYDSTAVIRIIVATNAYQLSSVANKTNMQPSTNVAFSRMQTRPLSHEQLIDSLLVAILPNAASAQREEKRRAWLKALYSAPLPPTTECEFAPANPFGDMTQQRALWVAQSDPLNEVIHRNDALPAIVAREHPEINVKAIDTLFLHTLSRRPTKSEVDRVMRHAATTPGAKANAARFTRTFYEDLLWALVNSAEFGMNH